MKPHILIIVMLVCSLVFVIIPSVNHPVSATDYSSWGYYRQCWVDQTNVDADLVNFPVLISISDAIGDKCRANGGDIRFTSQDNSTLYPYDIEKWVDGSARLVWVRIPRVDDAVNTSLWFHYGKPSATGLTNYTDVWDSNYVLVAHFNETSGGTCFDSSSKNHDGTYTGVTLNQAGSFGVACYFDGSNDYISFGDSDDFSPSSFTFLSFIKPGIQLKASSYTFSKEDASSYEYGMSWANVSKSLSGYNYGTGGGYIGRRDANGMTTLGFVWDMLTFSWDGVHDSTGIDIIINTTDTDDTAYSGGTFTAEKNTASPFTLGNDQAGTTAYAWRGYMDEFRFSSILRNDSWIKAEYYSMYAPSTFVQVSGVERGPGVPYPIIVSSVFPSQNSTGIPLFTELSIHVTHSYGYRINVSFYLVEAGDENIAFALSKYDTQILGGPVGEVSNATFWSSVHNSYFSADFLSTKYHWFVNITDGMGNSRIFPNNTGMTYGAYRCYDFTTQSFNGSNTTWSNTHVNTTWSHQKKWLSNSSWFIWDNDTGNLTPLHHFENIINATGTHFHKQNSTGYWIWANYSGNLTALHLVEFIVNAMGSHTYIQNLTGYWVNASYVGTAGNLSIINPNPGNGSHLTNYIKKAGNLTTSVDVFYQNFTTPPSMIPGTYSMTINSTLFTNTPSTWNTSTVYAWVWNNATGGIAPSGPLYVGQLKSGVDYTTFRSFLRFDTSSIPDEAIITSAYVKLIVWQDFSTTDFNVTLSSVKDPKPHNPLIPSDYGRSGIATTGGGHTNTTGYINDDQFNIVLNTVGINTIDKTFYTNFSVRSHKDINQTAPGGNEWITFYGNAMPIANYPKLIVNYTVPSSAWRHIVNLTFYNHSSGVPYNTTWVQSNGTVTVPTVGFTGVHTYSWNCSWNSNHTNYGNSSIWSFTTVNMTNITIGGGGSTLFISPSSTSSMLTTSMPLLIIGCIAGMLFMRRRKKERSKTK